VTQNEGIEQQQQQQQHASYAICWEWFDGTGSANTQRMDSQELIENWQTLECSFLIL
jgi:hypothetical protein